MRRSVKRMRSMRFPRRRRGGTRGSSNASDNSPSDTSENERTPDNPTFSDPPHNRKTSIHEVDAGEVVHIPSDNALNLDDVQDDSKQRAAEKAEEEEKEMEDRYQRIANRRRESSLSLTGAKKYFLESNADEASDSDDEDTDDEKGDDDPDTDSDEEYSIDGSVQVLDFSDSEDVDEDVEVNLVSSRRKTSTRLASIVEGEVVQVEWDGCLLEEIGTDKNVLWKLLGFLNVHEVIDLSVLSKTMRLALRDAPLRLDALAKVILYPTLVQIYDAIKWEDGKEMPKWHVSGVFSGVSDLNVLFELLDPARMASVGIGNRTFKDLSRIVECKNIEKAEFHSCFKLEDLKPLGKLNTLKTLLLLCCTSLKKLDPLSPLENLETLNLYQCNEIEDITCIAELRQLKQLGLAKCKKIKNHYPLLSLTNLQFVDLTENYLLESFDCLQNSKKLHLIHAINCPELKDISALASCGKHLQVLRLNGCEKVEDISALEYCPNLFHLRLDGLQQLKDISALKHCHQIKDLFLTGCSKIVDLKPLQGSMSSMFNLSLAGLSALAGDEASVLSYSKKLMSLELHGTSPDFLVQLLLSEVFFVRKTAKNMVIRRCLESTDFSKSMAEAIESNVLSKIDWDEGMEDEANNELRNQALHQIAEIANESEVAAAYLFDGIFETLMVFLKNRNVSMASKRSAQALVLALINRNKDASEKIDFSDEEAIRVFTNLIKDPETQDENSDGVIHYGPEAVQGMQILGAVLGKLNDSFEIALDAFKENDEIMETDRDKEQLKKKLDSMKEVNRLIDESGIFSHLLRIISGDFKDDFAKGAAYTLLLNFTTNASAQSIYNEVIYEEDVENSELVEIAKLPEALLEKGVPLILNSLHRIPVNVKMVAAGLLVSLIKQGGKRAREVLLESRKQNKTPDIIAFTKGLIQSGNENAYANTGNSHLEQFHAQMAGEFLKVASEMLQVLPREFYPYLIKNDVVQSMITPLEFSAQKVLEGNRSQQHMFLINADRNDSAVYAENIVNMTMALYQLCADPVICKEIGDSIPKAVPVIPLVLHAATDDNSVYLCTAKLLLRLLNGSEIYRSKVQLVYSNSDINVAIKVFDSAENDMEKSLGLQILNILMESNVFIEKLIDCDPTNITDFRKRFSKFVFADEREDEEKKERLDELVLSIAAAFVGKGVKGDSENFTLLRAFLLPEFKELKWLCETQPTDIALAWDKIERKKSREKKEEEIQTSMMDMFQSLLLSANNLFQNASEGNRIRLRIPYLNDDDDNNEAIDNAENQVPPVVSDVLLIQIASRVTCLVRFLEKVIGDNKAFAAMGLFDESFMKLLYTYLTNSNPLHAKSAHEAILKLFTTMFQLLKNLDEPMFEATPSDFAEESPETEINDRTNVPADANNGSNVHRLLDSRNDDREALARTETRRRELEQMELQRVMDRNRKQKLLEKLSNDLKFSIEDASAQINEENPFEIVAAAKMNSLWVTLCGTDLVMRQTIDMCVETLMNSSTDYGCSAALDLLVSFCEYSIKSFPVTLLKYRGDVIDHLKNTLLLDKDTRAPACRLAIYLGLENPDVIRERIIEPLSVMTTNYENKHEQVAAVRSISSLLANEGAAEILAESSVGENLVEYLVTVGNTLSFEDAEDADSKNSKNGLSESLLAASVLSDIVQSSPEILNSLLIGGSGQLGNYLVKLLLSENDTNENVAKLSVLVTQLLDNVLLSNDKKSLTELAEYLAECGVLEVISNWSKIVSNNESRLDPMENTRQVEKGLVVLRLALLLKDGPILEEVGLDALIPVLVELLMDCPSSRYASILNDLKDKDMEAISEQFLNFPIYKTAVESEMDTINRQRDDGDIIFNRVRGLPQEVDCDRKYNVTFGETWSTVAVKPEMGVETSSTKLYFEVEIVGSGGDVRIGWISTDFEQGTLFGDLIHGLGEDSYSWALGNDSTISSNNVTAVKSLKKNDFIGALVDIEKGTIQYTINGVPLNETIQVNAELLNKGFLPAVSAHRMKCEVNLGSKPFKHSPPFRDYVAFRKAFNA